MDIGNFNRPKNREDSSDFDDFLTESIATALAIIFKIFESPFCERTQNFCLFRSFICSFVHSQNIQILVRVAIDLVQKSSEFELSSRFFGRLKIFDFWPRQQV